MNDLFLAAKEIHNDLQTKKGLEVAKTSPFKINEQYDKYLSVVTDEELIKKTYKLFKDGHHARAIEEAFKYLDNLVYKKSRMTNSLSGDSLMRLAFSPNNPILKLNNNFTESEKNEQKGYMEIMAGCLVGIRNPRAHDSDWEDSEENTIELLALADHLIKKVKNTTYNKNK